MRTGTGCGATDKAEAVLRRWAGCCRKVWNLALAEQQARRERGEQYAGYVTMAKWVTAWRKAPETAYLAEVPVHVWPATAKRSWRERCSQAAR